MQEHEDITARDRRPGVHLTRSPARPDDDPIRPAPGERRGPVGASTVHDDDLVAPRAKRTQRREGGLDALGLVQHRHHDGEPVSAGGAAQFSAPPQLLPCPAVQP